MGAHSDFLTGTSKHEQREHRRRAVRLDAVLLYLHKGIRGCMQQKAIAVDLSEGGCMLQCPMPDLVSEHVYVMIAGINAKIGCAVIARGERRLNLRFSVKLPTEIVDRLEKRCA